MATKVITQASCDVCKSDIDFFSLKYSNLQVPTNIHVVFTTEQTEGRSVDPYLSLETIDICPACMRTILGGKMLFAEGAMGNNTYYFK